MESKQTGPARYQIKKIVKYRTGRIYLYYIIINSPINGFVLARMYSVLQRLFSRISHSSLQICLGLGAFSGAVTSQRGKAWKQREGMAYSPHRRERSLDVAITVKAATI